MPTICALCSSTTGLWSLRFCSWSLVSIILPLVSSFWVFPLVSLSHQILYTLLPLVSTTAIIFCSVVTSLCPPHGPKSFLPYTRFFCCLFLVNYSVVVYLPSSFVFLFTLFPSRWSPLSPSPSLQPRPPAFNLSSQVFPLWSMFQASATYPLFTHPTNNWVLFHVGQREGENEGENKETMCIGVFHWVCMGRLGKVKE